MSEYEGRIRRLQEAMRAQGAVWAAIAPSTSMRYLAGWVAGGHERLLALFVPATGEPVFVVPAMNAPQAKTNPAGIERVVGWNDEDGWLESVQPVLQAWSGGRDGGRALIDDELMSVHLLGLQALFPDLAYTPAGETMARLREIKTPDELAALERAAGMIDALCEEALGTLAEGMTEMDFAEILLGLMKREGTRPSFPPLICFGANSALPHHHTGDTKLRRGDVAVIDIGCLSDHYGSDITRTVAFGEPRDPEAGRVYEIVSQAYHAALEAARPGVAVEAVDAAARRVITDAGFGPQFIHRTGHGIGLSGHEPPYIVGGNKAPLQPGMCFSIEPGVYLPDRFGVRIENIVTVTTDGARSLNAQAPRQLRIV